MQEFFWVTGIVLKQTPIGEYDRRICLLTKEMGKISAIARGAKKPGSRFSAATNPFSFGKFKFSGRRDSYILCEVDIQNYFEKLMADFVGAYYGFYFCEIADYYTRENNDDREMMKLLYQSLRALCSEAIPNELIKPIYEIKSIVVNGEFPGVPEGVSYDPSTLYTINYIVNTPIEKLYTFALKENILIEVKSIADNYRKRFMDREFKSLEILKTLC